CRRTVPLRASVRRVPGRAGGRCQERGPAVGRAVCAASDRRRMIRGVAASSSAGRIAAVSQYGATDMCATIQRMKITDVGSKIGGLADRLARGETRVLVEWGGVPVAALVSPGDLERLDQIERETAEGDEEGRDEARWESGWDAIRQISQAFADVPVEEIERQVELALMEARAQLRAERMVAERLAARAATERRWSSLMRTSLRPV